MTILFLNGIIWKNKYYGEGILPDTPDDVLFPNIILKNNPGSHQTSDQEASNPPTGKSYATDRKTWL
jgi:hypothetical protein